MLESARQNIPEILPFVTFATLPHPLSILQILHCYQRKWYNKVTFLGLLLFCLLIHPLIFLLKAEFQVFYLDDGTFGDGAADVLHDF